MATLDRRTLDQGNAQTEGRANWLGEHGIELLVVATSLFTAACFCIGRANLMGWYDAAGIPPLTFSWSPQDLVIRGFLHSRTWWLLICSIGGTLLYYATLAFLAFAYRKLRSRWRSSRVNGWPAGNERDAPHDDARHGSSEMSVSCELLMEPVAHAGTKSLSKTSKTGDGLLFALGFASLMLVASAFVLGNTLLFAEPYAQGASSFRNQFLAATGHAAPRRVIPSVGGPQGIAKTASNAAPTDSLASGLQELGGYAFVEVSSTKDGGSSDPRVCGWLVQASGNQLLLLTIEGISMTNFGDGAFAWQLVDPESCALPRFSAKPSSSAKTAAGASAAAAAVSAPPKSH